MSILSIPRPNGSVGEQQTYRALQEWLTQRGISCHTHTFRLYPYFFEAIGIWLILSRTLLALAIWLNWGWLALLIATLGTLGGTLDYVFGLPLITWPGAQWGKNIFIEFKPSDALQEIIFSAHYDSKTELLDHHQRMFFLKSLPFGIFLTMFLGLLGPLNRWLLAITPSWGRLLYGLSLGLTTPLLFLAWGLGLNLSLGRLVHQSQGAVDNGAACAILLGLAERLSLSNDPKQNETTPNGTACQDPLRQTKVTLAIFTGEEVYMQGSRAFVGDRNWPLPTVAVNLEVMAQDGEYVFWEQDGNVFDLKTTSSQVNTALATTVMEVTGRSIHPAGPISSDGASFLIAGIPTGVLGTYDTQWKDTGFHHPTDNLGRVAMARLPEGVEIAYRLLMRYDQEGI